MGFLTFREINGSYRRWKRNDNSLNPIDWFLTDGTGGIFALKYIDDPEREGVEGNCYYLKFLRDKVIVGILFCEDDPQEIVMKRDNLRDIIKTWEKLKQQNVDEIVMRNNGDTVSMIGRSLTAKEKELYQQALEAFGKLPSIAELMNNQHLISEFENKWRNITPDEARELEREFYTQTINDESILWTTEEQ